MVVTVSLFITRAWLLLFQHEITDSMLELEERLRAHASRSNHSSPSPANRRGDKAGQSSPSPAPRHSQDKRMSGASALAGWKESWYVAHRHWMQPRFMLRVIVPFFLLSLIPLGATTPAMNVPEPCAADVPSTLNWLLNIELMVVVVEACFLAVLAFKLRKVDDALRIKTEFRIIGLIIVAAGGFLLALTDVYPDQGPVWCARLLTCRCELDCSCLSVRAGECGL